MSRSRNDGCGGSNRSGGRSCGLCRPWKRWKKGPLQSVPPAARRVLQVPIAAEVVAPDEAAYWATEDGWDAELDDDERSRDTALWEEEAIWVRIELLRKKWPTRHPTR
jgi:hypothetical protein